MPALRALSPAVLATAALALGACGDDEEDGGGASTSGGATTAQTTPAGGSGAASGVAGREPRDVVAAAADALAKQTSYRIVGTQTDEEDGTTKLEADVAADGRAKVRAELRGGTFEMRLLGDRTFLRADDGFWRRSAGAAAAQQLAGKWVLTRDDDLREDFEEVLPKTLARCLRLSPTGTLTKSGEGEVGGTPTVTLEDAGDKPGTAPGTLDVAAEGEPLPLRVRQTGPERPGGEDVEGCSDDGDDTLREDLTFSRYGEPVDVQAPAGALDLDRLMQQGQDDQTTS